MFSHLPDTLKQEVLHYLQNDNFRQAKAIYDAWVQENNSHSSSSHHMLPLNDENN